jgi:hypothetical protein
MTRAGLFDSKQSHKAPHTVPAIPTTGGGKVTNTGDEDSQEVILITGTKVSFRSTSIGQAQILYGGITLSIITTLKLYKSDPRKSK